MDNKDDIINDILKDLKNIHQNMNKSAHAYFKKFDVTPPQGMLIFLLNKNKKMKISEISNKMGLSNSTVSGIVDRLEEQKMVERIRSEKDRRVVFVQLTMETSKNFFSTDEIFHKLLAKAFEQESHEAIESIGKCIEKLSHNIEKTIEGEMHAKVN